MGVQSLFPMEAIGRAYELFERSTVRRATADAFARQQAPARAR